jgi:hypothetical protein
MHEGHQAHRGAHQEDRQRFAPGQLPVLREAVADLSWLLTRAYALDSALKLVGDRYQLHQRQRMAVRRAACPDAERAVRRANRRDPHQVAGRPVFIDGFNLLITVEAALSGGVIIRGRDRCLRDLASVHGTYRAVEETGAAITRVGEALLELGCGPATWYLDRPISNSGRLRQRLEEAAQVHGWPWTVEVCFNPDRALIDSGGPVVSSDAVILSRAPWIDLIGLLVERWVPEAWLIDLAPDL